MRTPLGIGLAAVALLAGGAAGGGGAVRSIRSDVRQAVDEAPAGATPTTSCRPADG